MSTNPYGTSSGPEARWREAADGLGLLRLTIVLSLAISILAKLIARGGLAGPVIELFASLVFGAMTISALARWKNLPPESGAGGQARIAWIGSIVGYVATCLTALMLLLALMRALRSLSLVESLSTVLIIVALAGSLLQIIGFLISAKTAGAHLRRPDVGTRAMVCLANGVAAAMLVVGGQIGQGRGSETMLVIGALAAIVALVFFLLTISALLDAINTRPSVAEVFS